MLDADLTYDFEEIPRFLATMEEGAEVVIGDRMDNIQPGAMPWLHRYIGNPLLTGLLNLFFRTGVSDAHCGMRGMRRDVLERLDLRSTGMEFASEMVSGPPRRTCASPSCRSSTTRAAARASCPPSATAGATCASCSCTARRTCSSSRASAWSLSVSSLDALVFSGVSFFGRGWGIHTLIAGALLAIVGTQVLALGLCAHAYGTYFMGEQRPLVRPHARGASASSTACCWAGR